MVERRRVTAMKRLPWQPGPNAAGCEAKSPVIAPIIRPPADGGQAGARPVVARGIAVKKPEYLAKWAPLQGFAGARLWSGEMQRTSLAMPSAGDE